MAHAVSRHCRRFRCSPDDRLDLAQDGYIAAYAAHSSYDPSAGASHNTWVARRVQGQLLDSTRKLRSRGMTHLPPELHHTAPIVDASADSDDAWESQIAPDSSSPEDGAGQSSRELVERLRAHMRPEDFQLLDRHYGLRGQEPESQREIAPTLGIGHQGVHWRLERARLRAKVILQS